MKRTFSLPTHFPVSFTDFETIKEKECSVYVIELLYGEVESCSPNAFTEPPRRETQEDLEFFIDFVRKKSVVRLM